jgi:hypothetical protein
MTFLGLPVIEICHTCEDKLGRHNYLMLNKEMGSLFIDSLCEECKEKNKDIAR